LLKRFFTPLAATGRLRRVPTRIIVVTAGANPSFSYYFSPRIARFGRVPVEVADIGAAPAAECAGDALSGAFVIFCRYMSGAWMRAVEAATDTLAGVGLFLDDDIDALARDAAIPLPYRLRLSWLHLAHRQKLARHCDALYVATPELAARHAGAQPRVLPPLASDDDLPISTMTTDTVRVAFHSTSVHAAEHRWLQPIMRSALAAEPSLSFEVIAGPPLSWRWRGLTRTRVMAPMPWPHYRAKSRARGADLLLSPLLPTKANAARSWTKRIDAMRLGAALLVSDPAVYRPDPEELSLGMCVPPDSARWEQAIRDLARDRERLARLRDLNAAHVQRASKAETPLIVDAMLPASSEPAKPIAR
jgi:hypothetical protein